MRVSVTLGSATRLRVSRLTYTRLMAQDPRPGLDREQALLDVVASIMSQSNLADLVRDLTEKLSRFVHFDRMVLLLYDEVRQETVSAGSHAAFPPELPLGYTSQIGETPGGEVIREQERSYIPDVALETRYPKLMRMLREQQIQALCYLPLTSPSRRIGALVFGTVSEVRYSEEDLVFMEEVLKPVAIAVENILNRERLEEERGSASLGSRAAGMAPPPRKSWSPSRRSPRNLPLLSKMRRPSANSRN